VPAVAGVFVPLRRFVRVLVPAHLATSRR